MRPYSDSCSKGMRKDKQSLKACKRKEEKRRDIDDIDKFVKTVCDNFPSIFLAVDR